MYRSGRRLPRDLAEFNENTIISILERRLTGPAAYASALICVAFTLLMRMALNSLLDDRATIILFIPSILIISTLGGLRPAFFAVVVAIAAAVYIKIQYPRGINGAEVAVFATVGLSISVI